jgi:hypothetical protein
MQKYLMLTCRMAARYCSPEKVPGRLTENAEMPSERLTIDAEVCT